MIVRRDFYIGGSGSVYAMGFLDATYRPNMNRDECIDMVKKAIAMSIARDGSSGGCTRYAIVTKDGVERNVILNNELMRFHEQ
jgi:20S proteasome subunit beta 1